MVPNGGSPEEDIFLSGQRVQPFHDGIINVEVIALMKVSTTRTP